MKASEIAEHFMSVADWVDPANTVDGIIIGDPEKYVRTALVTWISSMDAVREAADRGFDLLVTHEPTFYAHRGERDYTESSDIALAKKRLIEESGLVVLRNHDCWDRMPQIGIPWSWARFLELGEEPVEVSDAGYQHRYDIDPVMLDELAHRIAAKTALMAEPVIQVAGDGNRVVSKVGIGTGCGCRIDVYRDMGCDVSVVCDDGTSWWAELQRAVDADHPVIRVNHGSSEDPGMVNLARYISETFPEIETEHRPHKGYYRLVG